MNILIVVGTRPEIIKMAPVIKELDKRNIDFYFIHTGQHYDYELSKVFIDELRLNKPDVSFKLENINPTVQIGEMMIKLSKVIDKINKPNIMLIQGDTNTMLAAGLTALKLNIKIGHIEAGLRSHDRRMQEEHNRRMIDHVSDYLFAPTEISKRNLIYEKVWGNIYVTGNTIIDALNIYFNYVNYVEKNIDNIVKFDKFLLVTFHRAENVDNPRILGNFVRILQGSPLPIVFPIHPRTKKRLYEYGLWNKINSLDHVQILPPQSYFNFLALMKNCELILTDSGGIQEEATYPKIKKYVLVLRDSTERPEAVLYRFAKVVGTNPVTVLSEVKRALENNIELPEHSPFGDGRASERIVNYLVKNNLN